MARVSDSEHETNPTLIHTTGNTWLEHSKCEAPLGLGVRGRGGGEAEGSPKYTPPLSSPARALPCPSWELGHRPASRPAQRHSLCMLDFTDGEAGAQRDCHLPQVHTARTQCLGSHLQVSWLLVQSQSAPAEPGSVLKAALISCGFKSLGACVCVLLVVSEGQRSHRYGPPGNSRTPAPGVLASVAVCAARGAPVGSATSLPRELQQ